MKTYAIIKNNEVINVQLFDSPSDSLLEDAKQSFGADYIIDCTDNEKVEIGGTWDTIKFIRKKPFNSWILDEETDEWKAPIPKPNINTDNPQKYRWNEEILNWEEIQVSE